MGVDFTFDQNRENSQKTFFFFNFKFKIEEQNTSDFPILFAATIIDSGAKLIRVLYQGLCGDVAVFFPTAAGDTGCPSKDTARGTLATGRQAANTSTKDRTH